MREVLRELNTTPGVHGSAVVMADGLIVASELAAGTDPESFAALVSSLLSHISRNLPKLQMGRVKRLLVTAITSKVGAADYGVSTLKPRGHQ